MKICGRIMKKNRIDFEIKFHIDEFDVRGLPFMG